MLMKASKSQQPPLSFLEEPSKLHSATFRPKTTKKLVNFIRSASAIKTQPNVSISWKGTEKQPKITKKKEITSEFWTVLIC